MLQMQPAAIHICVLHTAEDRAINFVKLSLQSVEPGLQVETPFAPVMLQAVQGGCRSLLILDIPLPHP